MRVSLDVDDTLVCPPGTPTEQHLALWRRPWYNEKLRLGTRELLDGLTSRRCELWIYTTSYRSLRYLNGWFRGLGYPLCGAVNQATHDRVVGRQGPSKFPPAFGIDVHVDDSQGVALEGKRHGFAVVVVSPEDRDWVARILYAVDSRLDSRGLEKPPKSLLG